MITGAHWGPVRRVGKTWKAGDAVQAMAWGRRRMAWRDRSQGRDLPNDIRGRGMHEYRTWQSSGCIELREPVETTIGMEGGENRPGCRGTMDRGQACTHHRGDS